MQRGRSPLQPTVGTASGQVTTGFPPKSRLFFCFFSPSPPSSSPPFAFGGTSVSALCQRAAVPPCRSFRFSQRRRVRSTLPSPDA
ncbi:hypothetical protein CHLRE_06g299926v5 [Chlamydomonas reinhardtii]|uniref:Uncharacterized protein n=1 Tax=Chlamydomonas reinhardtii TaxID=3055 RepID=A0A2K3DQV5_CHLRE|nr:uncharacterized protein CHLRE_06g299926v5 [Chlamydomonas reinhardtii]PNW82925.1 hypothetical protein CHLRE_06g299926v5 [Chlamydomonas reinhardtii]